MPDSDLKKEIIAAVLKHLPEMVPQPTHVLVEVNLKYSTEPHIEVIITPPPNQNIPEEFWQNAIDSLPEGRLELKLVLQIFRDNGNLPLTISELSLLTLQTVGLVFNEDKIRTLNTHLCVAQPGFSPLFLIKRLQLRLKPEETARYYIKKVRF